MDTRNKDPFKPRLRASSEINLTSDLDKIFYPKYWFLGLVIVTCILVVVSDIWLYKEYVSNQENLLNEKIEAVAEEFNLSLLEIENKLLQVTKDIPYEQMAQMPQEDILNLLSRQQTASFHYKYFIDDIRIDDRIKPGDKKLVPNIRQLRSLLYEDHNLYFVIATKLFDKKLRFDKEIKLFINVNKITHLFLSKDNNATLLEFSFVVNKGPSQYNFSFFPGNQLIRKMGEAKKQDSINNYFVNSKIKFIAKKEILSNPNWMINGYFNINLIQDFIWFLVKISIFIMLAVLLIANLIYKKLYFLEWQKINITKDKRHFQQRAEITLASINEGVIIVNSTAQIVYINHVMEEYLQDKFINIYFKTYYDLIPELANISNVDQEQIKLNDLNIKFNKNDYIFDVQFIKLYDEQGHYIGASFFLHDLTAKKKAQDKINYLAYFDEPTELPNRVSLVEKYKKIINLDSLSDTTLKTFTLVLSTPSLKNINDTIGYEHGDETIRQLLDILGDYINKNNSDDKLYRVGSNTFVVLISYKRDLHGKSSMLYITNYINNLLSILTRPIRINEQDIFLQFYFGVSIYPDNFQLLEQTPSPELLLRYAEIAMSAARKKGLNKYAFYSDDIYISSQEKFNLENELRSAIANDKLELLFHPQLDLKTSKLKGFETLIRWLRDDGSLVSPNTFIPVLEKSGLIVTVGDWILREACLKGNELIAKGVEFDSLAVNISGLQLQTENFIERLKNIIDSTGFPVSKLELEITESILLENPDKIIAVLADIREYGVTIALDDFGTGFSSLSYLKQLPLDYLKIDRSFVNEINTGDTRLLLAILAISKTMNLITIAEGVETVEQVNFLRQNLCDIIQGYYISRPLPLDAVIKTYC